MKSRVQLECASSARTKNDEESFANGEHDDEFERVGCAVGHELVTRQRSLQSKHTTHTEPVELFRSCRDEEEAEPKPEPQSAREQDPLPG